MPRMLIGLIHGPICPLSNLVRHGLERPPEIGEQGINVVDRLDTWRVRPTEQHGTGAEKRLHIIRHIAEALPHHLSHARLAAEPREGRGQGHRGSSSINANNGALSHTCIGGGASHAGQ